MVEPCLEIMYYFRTKWTELNRDKIWAFWKEKIRIGFELYDADISSLLWRKRVSWFPHEPESMYARNLWSPGIENYGAPCMVSKDFLEHLQRTGFLTDWLPHFWAQTAVFTWFLYLYTLTNRDFVRVHLTPSIIRDTSNHAHRSKLLLPCYFRLFFIAVAPLTCANWLAS